MADATYYIKKNSNGGPTGRLKLQDAGGNDIVVHEISDTGPDTITFDRSATTDVKGWYVTITDTTFGGPTALTFNAANQATVSTATTTDHYVILFCDKAGVGKAPSNVSFTLKKKNTTGDD